VYTNLNGLQFMLDLMI